MKYHGARIQPRTFEPKRHPQVDRFMVTTCLEYFPDTTPEITRPRVVRDVLAPLTMLVVQCGSEYFEFGMFTGVRVPRVSGMRLLFPPPWPGLAETTRPVGGSVTSDGRFAANYDAVSFGTVFLKPAQSRLERAARMRAATGIPSHEQLDPLDFHTLDGLDKTAFATWYDQFMLDRVELAMWAVQTLDNEDLEKVAKLVRSKCPDEEDPTPSTASRYQEEDGHMSSSSRDE